MINKLCLTIEKPLYGGSGLTFINGKAVFVPLGVPGETYELKILNECKDYYEAEIIKIIKTSDKRIEPICPNFSLCGGCSYMHIDYDYEIEIKKAIVYDNLIRITRISYATIPEIKTIYGKRYHYRSHCEIKNENGIKGFFKRNSNKIIPLPHDGCAILSNEINKFAPSIISDKKNIKYACSFDGHCISSESNQDMVHEKIDDLLITRSLNQFYQANRFIRKDMLKRVNEYAGLTKESSFIDMHCGVGFFTLYLSKFAREGYGFDINKKSIVHAQKNAYDNGIHNIKFKAIRSGDVNYGRYNPDVILLDPPRSGLDKKTRRTVLAFNAAKIIYVSCNPSTFARDIKDIMDGGYIFSGMTLIDMFPCTHHIEIISQFIKNDKFVNSHFQGARLTFSPPAAGRNPINPKF